MERTESNSLDKRCQDILKELCDNNNNQSSQDPDRTTQLLSEFRILTREKTIIPSVLDENCLKTLVNYSAKSQIESQKCLSNLILNYAHLRESLVEPYVDCVEQRLNDILDKKWNNGSKDVKSKTSNYVEVLYYDLRIIFLLSALCSGSRASIRDRLLDLLLKVTLLEAENFCQDNYLLIIESLKTLFNLTMDRSIDTNLASKVMKKLFSVVGTESNELIGNNESSLLDHTDKLLVNLIHLLTNMPEEVYLELSDSDVNKVLNLLDEQLKTFSKSSFKDTILPVLNTCANICRYKEDVRQHWFEEIIGSTKDFEKRPEEYDTLRGRLVKLMTSVDVHIKEIAAEFLHALCGGDTEKFITYTGFGNSAAFLSTKGLLSQISSKDITVNEQGVSQETDSDKEYQELRGKLDPITGKLEQLKKNPMEGMSDEEKEWHAHELAEAITKLSSLGVVKPMQIGPDAKMSELCPRSNVKNGNSGKENDDNSE